MAGRAAGHHFLTTDLVIGFQVGALFCVDVAILPIHVVDLRFRPNKFLRLTVASQAPFHLKRILLINSRHIVDLSVTGRTADAFSYVNAVVEIRIFRQVVNPFPFDRLVVLKAVADGGKVWAVGPDLAVAVHTGLRWRHASRSGRFDRRVAIAAIDAVVANVVFVAELNWLLFFDKLPGQVRRAGELRERKATQGRQHYTCNNANSGDIIRAFIKKLSHLPISRDLPLRKSLQQFGLDMHQNPNTRQ